MIYRLLTSGILAGAAAGLIAALLQFYFVIPVLLEGELFETGAMVHFATDGSPQSDRTDVALGGDWGRHALTLGFNMLGYAGFGLLLVALMALAEQQGLARITPRQGLIWGLAGFIAVQLAPAIGLPPELPGTVGAEIGPRQAWWMGTIIASAIGLWCLAFAKGPVALVGIAFLLAPHVIGAPHLDAYWGVAPPELAAEFATLSLGAAAAGWTVLGFVAGWLWSRET